MIEEEVIVNGAAKKPSIKLVTKWGLYVYKNFLGYADEEELKLC